MSMKNSLFILIAFVVLIISACETDFELEGEWKDIPVVYTFLSEQDTAHYVRVEKIFLEPKGDATQIAQIADSLYYKENQVTVSLETNGQSFILERVNAEDEGYPRELGVFANTPSYLYKLSADEVDLKEGQSFEIKIDRGTNTKLATASSQLLHKFELDGIPITGFLSFGDYIKTYRLSWRPGGDLARVFDLRLIFRYRENSIEEPTVFVNKEVDWVLDDAFVRGDENTSLQTFRFKHEAFYQFLNSSIEAKPGITRKFDNIIFKVVAAGKEIEEYLRIAGANTGVTSSQALPIYSNVENGLGVVTSRYTVLSEELSLDSRSRDSLMRSVVTGHLNFQP